MLSGWIVSTYKTLVEVALWVFIVVGGIFGAGIGGMMNQSFLGFLIGGIAAFFGMAVFLGAALVLGEILKTVKNIESKMQSDNK